jgi:hypothetical protein
MVVSADNVVVLSAAVIIGLLTGSLRAVIGKRKLTIPNLNHAWLVVAGLLPQIIVFNLPSISHNVPDSTAAIGLISSLFILFIFVLFNWNRPGFLLMAVGLVLNLLVIASNRGFMPIRPEAVAYLYPSLPNDYWVVGHRLGFGKDIILATENTRLWWLSDYFTLPSWFPYRVAFSLGDIVLSIGVIVTLWTLGNPPPSTEMEEK